MYLENGLDKRRQKEDLKLLNVSNVGECTKNTKDRDNILNNYNYI